MASDRRGSENQDQLYTFLEGLRVVHDRDERGSIIGYSIAKSLLTAEFSSRRKQLKHDEVRVVHDGLREAVERCTRYVPGSSSFSEYDFLCELRQVTDPLIANLRGQDGGDTEHSVSELSTLRGILESHLQKARNPPDRLRRDGLDLIDHSYRKGKCYGTGNILVADYETLKEVLIK